jgi:hypothetical protein
MTKPIPMGEQPTPLDILELILHAQQALQESLRICRQLEGAELTVQHGRRLECALSELEKILDAWPPPREDDPLNGVPREVARFIPRATDRAR